MSATRYKRPHVDIFICIEMGRERNQGIIKKHPVYLSKFEIIAMYPFPTRTLLDIFFPR